MRIGAGGDELERNATVFFKLPSADTDLSFTKAILPHELVTGALFKEQVTLQFMFYSCCGSLS